MAPRFQPGDVRFALVGDAGRAGPLRVGFCLMNGAENFF